MRRRDWTHLEREQRQDAMAQDIVSDAQNVDMVGSLKSQLEDIQDEFGEALDRMREATARYSDEQGSFMRGINNTYFEVYRKQADELSSSFSDLMSQIKDFMEEDEVELLEDIFENQKQQFQIYDTYYQREMKKERKTLNTFFKEAKSGMEEMSDKFGSLTDIINAINISAIKDSIQGGSESTVDVMSEVARIRGKSYDYVRAIKEALTEEDTFGGMISASDIMSVWKMSGVSDNYLQEIASYLAMFEKETETTNEDISELVYWSIRNGRTSEDLYKVLDDLSSVRNFDGIDAASITENLSEMINYLDQNRLGEYIAASAAAESNDLNIDVINDALKESVKGSLTGETAGILAQIEAFGGLQSGTLSKAAMEGDYDTLITSYAEAMKNIGSSDNTQLQKIIAEGIGTNLEEIQKYSQIDYEGFDDLINAIQSNTDTVADMSDTVGFVSEYDKLMNEESTSWVGDFFDTFELWTKDHPILTSLTGAAITGIISGITTVAGGAFVGWLAKGKAGKIFGKFAKHGDDIGKFAKHGDDVLDVAKHGDDIGKFAKHGDDVLDVAKHGDDVVDVAKHGDDVADAARAADSLDDVVDAADTARDTKNIWKSITQGVDYLKELGNLKDMAKSSDGVLDFLRTAKKDSKLVGPIGDILLDTGLAALIYGLSDSDYEKAGAAGEGIGSVVGDIAGWGLGGPLGALVLGFTGGELGEGIGQSGQNGIGNWGSFFAGDWNILNGLWRKDGTLTEQEMREEGRASAKSIHGGLPSDYGMPKVFDDSIIRTTGDINWSGLEGTLNSKDNNHSRMVNMYGMTYDELLKWKDSDEYKAYKQAAADIIARREDLGANLVNIKEGDQGYDRSLDKRGNGYNVWTGTEDEYKEWLKGQYFWGNGKIYKGDIEDAYMMEDLSKTAQDYIYSTYAKSASENTTAVEELTAEVSEMRKWLEANGYKGAAPWSDQGVRDTYNKEHGFSTFPNTLWNLSKNPLAKPLVPVNGSHADGLESVPYDGYIAELHKNERVLTAAETSTIDSIVEPIIEVDETVVHISETLVSISEILSDGFSFLGKKIDNIKVNVNNINRSSKQSYTSQFFSGLLGN